MARPAHRRGAQRYQTDRQRMTNRTKWLIAIPFTLMLSEVIPALISGNPAWFLAGWPEAAFFTLTVMMWLAATAFVDLGRTRLAPDRPRRLISLGLILVVPISVYDRVHLGAGGRSEVWSWLGVALCIVGALLGLVARRHLGRFYSPQPEASADHRLVATGPYRVIRHPLYTAALLWGAGWALLLASFWGLATAEVFLVPSVWGRIQAEEAVLLESLGSVYAKYQSATWRLIPFLY